MLTPESIQRGHEKKMVGSVIIFEAETLEAVKKLVENDIYYTSGVVCLSSKSLIFRGLKFIGVVGSGETCHSTLRSY